MDLLHQFLEGQVLMGQGGQHHRSHPGHEFPERRLAGEVGAEGEGVDEIARQILQLGGHAPGHGRAHQEFVLVGMA